MELKLLDILKLEHSDIHLALFAAFGLFLLADISGGFRRSPLILGFGSASCSLVFCSS
jgi:hypothetical protein